MNPIHVYYYVSMCTNFKVPEYQFTDLNHIQKLKQ